MNILAIGAHPDDIDFGCGGALLKYGENGHNVYMLILSKGEKGGDPEIRQREQESSAQLLKVKKLFFGGYLDTEITLDRELIITIEKVLDQVKPDFIFVNFLDDTHQDHRNLARATMSATRHVKNVLFFEGPTTQHFTPNVFIDIETVLDKKLECLKAHASQVSKTNIENLTIIEVAKSAANFRGIQGKVRYAEAFQSLRLFINI